MWTYWIHDARTGDPILQVFPRKADAGPRIAGTGEGSHVFDLLDRKTKLPRAVLHDLFRENDRFITQRWGSFVAYAGLLLRPVYTKDDGLLDVRSKEIRAIWAQRKTFPMNDYSLGDLTITGKDIPGWVRAILERGMQWADEWQLPIDLPPDGAGEWGGFWERFKFLNIEDLLGMVEAQGYEILFRPYLTGDNRLRFDVPIGRPILSGVTDLPVSVKKSAVSGLTETRDGSRQLSGVIFAGNGTDADMVTGYAGVGGSAGGPRMIIRDASRADKDERDPVRLTGEAVEELRTYRSPTKQWSFDVDLTSGFSPADLQIGRLLRMDVRDDPWIDDALHEQRSIGMRINETLTVTPEVQAYGG